MKTESSVLAKRLVMAMLLDNPNPTQSDIRAQVSAVMSMLKVQDPAVELDEEVLVRDVESSCNVWVPAATTLEDARQHVEWLANKRADIGWQFWQRHRTYLRDVVQLPPDVIRQMDQTSDELLRRLEDPARPGLWDRRGLVVGQVQSGKTGSYLALICKAIDSGYRLIVVLAGMHNSLRSQTQLRMDQGVIGFDTQKRLAFDQTNVRMGVGALQGFEFYRAQPLTNSADNGDFKLNVARSVGVVPGGAEPVILVVKKHGSILQNVIKWATLVLQQQDPDSGKTSVRGVPLLVIDDEADNASINTKKTAASLGVSADEIDPTKVNGHIRELLNSFEQKAYVGYTATPFANIFIDDRGRSFRFGEELFPRSFIMNLKPPSDYMGPTRVFGLQDGSTENSPGLPILREVHDHDDWIPDRHKKEWVPGSIPESLKVAMQSFILTIASRLARGQQNTHNSMLVHVTRYNAVQDIVADQIADELSYLVNRLGYGDGASSDLRSELQKLWERDFLPTSRSMMASASPWKSIEPLLYSAASRIQVKKINGYAKDALEYFENPSGLNVIAVGGDKLSRGLTLEGLSVSYYLRASKMYDTLMQMGRWFGYRPRYEDLCRLYTTPDLIDWYRDITAASEELRQEFDHMVASGRTPEDFGLRVRNHPDGLLVTARSKMRNGQKIKVSYSGAISESINFFNAADELRQNFVVTESFLRSLGDGMPRRKVGSGTVWTDVNGQDVAAYLEAFKSHPDSKKAQGQLIAKYIRARTRDGELLAWTVALISNSGSGAVKSPIADTVVGLIQREPMHPTEARGQYVIKRLISPKDELLDLSDEQVNEALKLTQYEYVRAAAEGGGRFRRTTPPEDPGGPQLRAQRSPRTGLLLIYPLDPAHAKVSSQLPVIGWATSLSVSASADPAIEYTVNNVYWEQEFGEL